VNESRPAVFLSYASEDTSAAQRISSALRAAGIETWFDKSELRGGDAWDNQIKQQIKACALFIPVISANSRARTEGYFRLEWKLAVDRSHLMADDKTFLLPVVVDDTPEADARVPDKFRQVQWTHLPAGDPPPAFIAEVARLLSASDRGPAASSERHADGSQGHRLAPTHSGGGRPRAAWLAWAAAAAVIMGAIAAVRLWPAQHGMTTGSAASGSDKSIAVLPFVDMSQSKDQEYFSDGLAEELIDLLAKIPDLKVAARTSSFSFRGRAVTIGEIGQTLKVANVLEGSLRKSGQTVRVTAQLVRADNGYHLWSETYDSNLSDVFKIQDDIARAVVDKLKLTLLTAEPRIATRTANPEVHDLYLQGGFAADADTDDGIKKAIDFWQRALALDPNYAPAWALLSRAYYRQVANGYVPAPAGIARTLAAAHKATELDPSLAEPYVSLALARMSAGHDWAGARTAVDTALRLEPNNSHALFLNAHLTRSVGDADDAMVLFHQALERDPLDLLQRRYVARALYFAGRLAEAEAMIRQILAKSPSFSAAHYELGRILLARGQVAAAVAAFEAESSPGWREFGLPLGYHAAGRTADANTAFAALLRDSAGSEYQVAETYAYFGDSDQAFTWLDRAVDVDPGIQWIRGDPLLKSLTGDPRYAALLHKLNLPP
jgi:TolB-like protein/cytochrome c-type biogenesis protein CcmH/NrfG